METQNLKLFGLLALAFCVFVLVFFSLPQLGDNAAEAKITMHASEPEQILNSIEISGESPLDAIIYTNLIKMQLAETTGKTFTVSQEETGLIEKKIENFCVNGETENCPISTAVMPYYLYLKQVKGINNLLMEGTPNPEFRLIVLSWKTYFLGSTNESGEPAINPADMYEFGSFLGILKQENKLSVIENQENKLSVIETEKFLEMLKRSEMPGNLEKRDAVRFALGKMIAIRSLRDPLLDGVPSEFSEFSFVRRNNILEAICPKLPSEEEILEMNDPCIISDYADCRRFCGTANTASRYRMASHLAAQGYSGFLNKHCKVLFILNSDIIELNAE